MAALTRIFNNQIYNATIIGYQKIAPGSITGSLFASNVTVPGDLLISGNLFVLGTSAYTTIASTNTYVNDPLVTLNNGFSGTNNRDIGLVLNRGTDQNQAIVWAEPFKEFRLIGTTETGTTYGNVVASNFANLHVGNIGVDYAIRAGSLSVNSAITASSLNLSGNLLASTVITNYLSADDVVFGNVSASLFGNVGATYVGASINLSANVLAAAGTFNALTVNGGITSTGYFNTSGNISTAQLNAGQINTTGNVLATAGVFNGLTVNGNESVTGFLNVTGNILGAAGTLSGLTVNGNESVTGFLNVTGNVMTAQLNAGQINTTGNVLATAGTFNALTVNGNETVTGFLNVTGNILGAAGTLSGLTVNGNETVTGFLNVGGNIIALTADVGGIEATGVIYANSSITSTTTGTGAVIIAGGTGIAGNLNIGTVGAVGGAFHTVRGNITQSSSGGAVYFNTSGNVMAAQGSFGSINSTGYINTSGNISTAQLNAGQINTTGNVLATAGVFNALTVNGNESVTGFLNVTGNVMAAVVTASQFNTTGNVLATAGVFNALTVNGNESVTGFLNVTGNILGATGTLSILGVNNNLWANASIATTTQGTGAIVVPNGGISVSGNANIAGSITSAGAAQFNNTVTVGGITSITNTTNATEPTGSSGALRIAGGASIAKDLWIGGNIYASNIFGVTEQLITVQDPLLYLTASNTFPYTYDIGVFSQFVGPDPVTGTGNAYQHTGLVRDASDYTWKFFSNVRAEPTATVPFNADTIYDPLLAGNLRLTYTQAATSTTTGALQVAGGAGVAGTVVAAQLNSTGNVLGQAGTFNALTVNGGITSTGYFNTSGNISTAQLNAGQINTTGNVLASTIITNYLSADDVVFGNVSAAVFGNVGATFTGASINLSGNVLAAAGTFNALTVNGNETITGFLNVTGNVLASTVGASFLTASTVAVGNIAAVNFGNTGATFTGASINLSGNVLAASGIYNYLDVNGNVDLGLLGAISGSWVNVIGNITQSTSGGAVYFNTAGNVMASQGSFGSINSTGFINTSGNISTAQLNAGQINTTGNVLASTVRASFLTASTVAVGNISAVTIGNSGATITGTIGAFSGNVIGGLAQFAAINATPIGNATASTGSFTDLRASGTLWANAATDSTTTGIGAIVVPNGGISASGNINVVAGKQFIVGQDLVGEVFLPQATAQFFSNINGYSQVNQQNISTGTGASSDFIATSSNGNDSTNYIDFGINGINYNQAAYGITKANDGYLYVQGNTAVSGGNLVIGVATAPNDIIFFLGSTESTAEVARFDGNVGTNGNLRIRYATTSTSTTTGAFQVVGGVGIGGNLRAGGGAVFNSGQTADPFQVRGVATTSLIYADTAQGAVIIGGSNVAPQLGSTLKINGVDSLLLPVGSTGQRPGATGNIDVAGMIRFNTTIQNMEFYDGSQWQTAGSVFTVVSSRQFSGNTAGGFGNVDGTNTTFTLQANSTTAGTIVSINGVVQFPTLAYSVSGTTLTFTEPPAPDDVIDARVLTTTSTVSSLANGNGLQQFIASDTALEFWSGVSATTKQAQINKVGDFEFLTGGKTTYTQTATNIAANNTPYVIATYSQTAYTTAKFLISAKRGTTNFQSMETMVTADGQGNAFVTTYAVVSNGVEMGGVTANVVGSNVQLYWTTTTNITNANVKAMGTFIV